MRSFFPAFMLVLLAACDIDANTGLANIEGVVMTDLYNELNDVYITSYPAQDEEVFIIYGDNDIYDDDTRTHFNGAFQFRNLRPGNYTLFLYSDCIFNVNDCPSGNTVVTKEIEITSRRETAQADTITIRKYN